MNESNRGNVDMVLLMMLGGFFIIGLGAMAWHWIFVPGDHVASDTEISTVIARAQAMGEQRVMRACLNDTITTNSEKVSLDGGVVRTYPYLLLRSDVITCLNYAKSMARSEQQQNAMTHAARPVERAPASVTLPPVTGRTGAKQ